jgi:hypothetical protein
VNGLTSYFANTHEARGRPQLSGKHFKFASSQQISKGMSGRGEPLSLKVIGPCGLSDSALASAARDERAIAHRRRSCGLWSVDRLAYSRSCWYVWDGRIWSRGSDEIRRKRALRAAEVYKRYAD